MINRCDVSQAEDEIVDISEWTVHEDYEVYPVGARDKSLRICPNDDYSFCLAGHKYLFKESIKSVQDPSKPKFPDQYWAEIIAFKIGRLMGLSIPPTFVAYNPETGQSGALIEWFTGYPGQHVERFVAGGDIMQEMIEGYDRDKGRDHNLNTISIFSKALNQKKFLSHNWKEYWGLCLCFDALIGNTDRHQENWGLLWTINSPENISARFTPYYDNGTSLGHEIFPNKFSKFMTDPVMLNAYISRGRHQMKWDLSDDKRLPLIGGVIKFAKKHPEVILSILKSLDWDDRILEHSLNKLVLFGIDTPLSQERAEFIHFLTISRKKILLGLLGKLCD